MISSRYLKDKDFPKVRKWVVDNLDNDPHVLLVVFLFTMYGIFSSQAWMVGGDKYVTLSN